MRKLLFVIALVCGFNAHGQGIIFTAPLPHTSGAPTGNPSAQGARMRYDTTTNELFTNVPGTGWMPYKQGIDRISGTIPPAYTPNKGQSDWAVNGANPPELYYYTGSVWLRANPVGTTYTAGEGIAIDGTTIRIDTLDRLTFNQSPTLGGGVGTFRWNDTDGTLDLGLKGGNVTLQLGQETVHRAVNKHGSTIANGEVVRVYGAQGNRISIRKASAAADSLSQSTFGVATEDIINNQEGFVTAQGLVRGLNTSGFTEGAPLYLSATTPGALTQTQPAAPAHSVLVGYCVRSHAVNGYIWVEVQRGFNLGELHDVSTSAATNGQVLTYNSSTKVWSGATVADQSATNELQTLSQGSTMVTLSNGGGTVNVDPSTTNELNTGLTVGSGNLNLTDAGGTLSVPVVSIAPDQSATNEIQTLSISTNTLSLSNGGGSVTVDPSSTNEIQTLSLSGADLTLSLGGGTVTLPGGGGDGNGIYSGSGSVPDGTVATLDGVFNFQPTSVAALTTPAFGVQNYVGDFVDFFGSYLDANNYVGLARNPEHPSGTPVLGYYLQLFDSELGAQTSFLVQPDGFDFSTGTSSFTGNPGSIRISNSNTGRLKVEDTGAIFEDFRETEKGIEYAADYSAILLTNPRSLPDVGTVAKMLGSATTVTGATSAIANSNAASAGVPVDGPYRWDDGSTIILCFRK